jgi:prepilin peptidase CpaA
MNEPHHHAVLIFAVLVSALAAIFDWRRGQIPNWLTYGAVLAAPILHGARMLLAHEPMNVAMTESGFSLCGAVVCALVPVILYRQGALGAGDVKLLCALGAILQTMFGVEAEMYGFFAAALFAPARLAYEGKLFATLKNVVVISANAFLPKSKQRNVEESTLSWLRLGPPIFVGVLLTAYLHW